MSNLYAATSATLTGSDTATVEVIDNTTGAKLLSCTVNSTSKNNCSNNAETGSAAAGNKLEVKITTSGKSGASKDWEVTFRYYRTSRTQHRWPVPPGRGHHRDAATALQPSERPGDGCERARVRRN